MVLKFRTSCSAGSTAASAAFLLAPPMPSGACESVGSCVDVEVSSTGAEDASKAFSAVAVVVAAAAAPPGSAQPPVMLSRRSVHSARPCDSKVQMLTSGQKSASGAADQDDPAIQDPTVTLAHLFSGGHTA